MLSLVRSQFILDLLSNLELTKHDLCPEEDNVGKFRQETEEMSVKCDAVANLPVKTFTVVIGFESVHIDTETLWTNLLYPETNDVRLVKDEQLSSSRGVDDITDSLLDAVALDGYFVGWK
jgi:hypothetical protein